MTQILAHGTRLLDSRKKVPMTVRTYCTAVLPIGVFFSGSLIFGNVAYVYISVAFIQILKSTTPVTVLLCSWAFRVSNPDMKTLANVTVIVIGVAIASFGEIKFNILGFLFQLSAVVCESIRLVMMQRLLSSSADLKMDPLVSLYYFAPACAFMNGIVALMFEVPNVTMADVANVGYSIWLISAVGAFLLNVSTVYLVSLTVPEPRSFLTLVW